MGMRSIHRVPAEIWTYILDLVVADMLPRPPNTHIIEDLRFSASTKEQEYLKDWHTSIKIQLSLVCRLYRDILRGRLVVSTEPRKTYTPDTLPSDLSGLITLVIPDNLESLPPTWEEQEWPMLETITTNSIREVNSGVQSITDLPRLLNRVPNLKALSCLGQYPYQWTYADASVVSNLLQTNAIYQQLTHLSIHVANGQRLDSLQFPSLRFLCLQISYDAQVDEHGEMVPWTCPMLRALSIQGGTTTAGMNSLIPFFDRHSATVIDLVERIALQINNVVHRSGILQYFPDIRIYGTNGSTCQMPVATRPSQSYSSEELRPLTFLLMAFPYGDDFYEPTKHISLWLSDLISPYGPYIATKMVINTRWKTFSQWLEEIRMSSAEWHVDILSRLKSIAVTGFPVIDWDGMTYKEAEEAGIFDQYSHLLS